jgi:hypothetical protein
MSPVSPRRRLALAVTAALSAMAATAGPAVAAGCPVAPLSNPFAAWGDHADYQLAPDGSIEGAGAVWSLRGGAVAQEGNETFTVTSPTDHLSLRVPAGGAATTKRMCLGVEHTTFRLFAKRGAGSSTSRLAVDVVADDPWGRERSLTVGVLSGSSSWAPSPVLPTVANLLAPLTSNAIDVSFRFRPLGDATWSIDDVYVDPYRTH